MPSVFLSYTPRDREQASRIAAALEARGVSVWIDQMAILPGDEIQRKIEEGIRNAQFFVVLLSQGSVASKWVTYELNTALRHNADAARTRIIPVRIDDVEVPSVLASYRYVDLRRGFDDGIDEIVRAFSASAPQADATLGELVDVSVITTNVEETQKQYRGSGYGVTTPLP